MNVHKTCELKYVPSKINKMNADVFVNFISLQFSYYIDLGEFPLDIKHADIVPLHKKKKKVITLITDLSAYC